MAQDKVKGKTNEVVGAGRRKVGEATGNEKMEGKGAAQQVKGKAQQALGSAKDAAGKAKDAVKDKLAS